MDFKYDGQLIEQNLSLPDMIVWDMDGTLLQSKAGRFVGSDNESKARRALELADVTFKKIRRLKDLVAPNLHLSTDAKSQILSYVTKMQEDAIETLEAIQRIGLEQAIVSNNSRSALGSKVLKHFNIAETIPHSVFIEDMAGLRKPNPEIMRRLMEQTEMPDNANIWVVGDSTIDMRFAQHSNRELTQNFTPIAMGMNSRAARYLEVSASRFESFAIAKNLSDVAIMASLDPYGLQEYDSAVLSASYDADDHSMEP
ncbi:MAG: HAD family hydrolase [Alcanivorax sp.]